jgi:two-component system sensor histidine kinase CpxA
VVETAEPVDLTALVAEIVADCDFEARESGRQVVLVSSDACRTVGDRDLLRRAIENVVRNAVRHTADGTAVEVSVETGLDASTVRVRDHGPGVPEESLAEIFRPFFRVGSARDRTSGGTGLGLAITRRAVEAHGGEVVARNVPTGGLEIAISLGPQ